MKSSRPYYPINSKRLGGNNRTQEPKEKFKHKKSKFVWNQSPWRYGIIIGVSLVGCCLIVILRSIGGKGAVLELERLVSFSHTVQHSYLPQQQDSQHLLQHEEQQIQQTTEQNNGLVILNNNNIIPTKQLLPSVDPLQWTLDMLQQHPLHSYRGEPLLEEVMFFLSQQRVCKDMPIFVSMANVPSQLYWQLIENFIYTMTKFELIHCSLMICVSDERCMRLCDEHKFPCFHYNAMTDKAVKFDHEPPALEQIAVLKLFQLPKTLLKGVDIFTLDLDAGFVDDPRKLVRIFHESEMDILVQRDISFVMHRSVELWRTWYTVSLPNIGIMICKGNRGTAKVFERAWQEYQKSDIKIRKNPGKDQNKVVGALQAGRAQGWIEWDYFPGNSTVLIDKVHKNEDDRIELGGEQAAKMLQFRGAVAAHATCYEKDTKMMALKAVNAFWNPFYYDPNRRTLTKQLIYISEKQLRDEIRSLVYLAKISNRSLIIPNILGKDDMSTVTLFEERLAFWPGFRVVHFNSFNKRGDERFDASDNFEVSILEPAFYWRIQRDYVKDIPPPTIISFDSSLCPKSKDVGVFIPCKVTEIEKKLLSSDIHSKARIILNFYDKSELVQNEEKFGSDKKSKTNGNAAIASLAKLATWASDSVGGSNGIIESYQSFSRSYHAIPALSYGAQRSEVSNTKLSFTVIDAVRPCAKIFHRIYGNRSCFDKCK